MHKHDTAQSEYPVPASDRSEGAGVVLTWFPATEVESQPVSELVLDLHQPLCQLVVPPLPAHTQTGDSQWHTQMGTETHLAQANAAPITNHSLVPPCVPQPKLSLTPGAWALL